MIISALLNLVYSVLSVLLVFNLPELPASVVTIANNVTGYMVTGVSILASFEIGRAIESVSGADFLIDFASFLRFSLNSISNGGVRIASPLPIERHDPKGNPYFLQKNWRVLMAILFCSVSRNPQLIIRWTVGRESGRFWHRQSKNSRTQQGREST